MLESVPLTVLPAIGVFNQGAFGVTSQGYGGYYRTPASADLYYGIC